MTLYQIPLIKTDQPAPQLAGGLDEARVPFAALAARRRAYQIVEEFLSSAIGISPDKSGSTGNECAVAFGWPGKNPA